jgi:hypothetical protein
MIYLLQEQVVKDLKDVTERIYTVEEGIKQYAKIMVTQALGMKTNTYVPRKETKLYVYNSAKDPKELSTFHLCDDNITERQYDTNKSITQQSLEDEQDNSSTWKYRTVKEKIQTITNSPKEIPDIKLSDKDKKILKKLELEHEKNIKNHVKNSVSSSIIKTDEKKNISTKPKERPTVKSVKPKHTVRIKIKIFNMTYGFSSEIYIYIYIYVYYICSYHLLPERGKFLLQGFKEW